MQKKIVAIYGSYRKNGNSSFILNTVLNSINEEVEVQKYYLSDMNINGCKGCFYCRKNENCIIRDDMDMLIESIKRADKVIISIPIFMFQASGNIKLMLDRLYPLLKGENGQYTKRMNDKDTIVIYSQGSPNSDSFSKYMELNKTSFSLLGFDIKETLICTKSNSIGAVKNNLDLCNQAKNIAEHLFG